MIENNATPNRLYRSRKERVLVGVAGGLAQYFGVDPVIPRIAFVLVALTPGFGFLAILSYIVMAIVVNERPEDEPEPMIEGRVMRAGRGAELFGYLLVGLGVIVLAGTLGLFNFVQWHLFWPVLLIGAGVLLLFRHRG